MLLFYNVCFVLNWEIAAKTAARGKSFRAPAGNTGAVFDVNYLKHLWQHNMTSLQVNHNSVMRSIHIHWWRSAFSRIELKEKAKSLTCCRNAAGWKDPVVEPAQWPEPDISALLLSKSARLLTHRHLDNFLHPCLALEWHENRKKSQCDHVRSWVWIHSTASKTVYLSTQSELTLFPNWQNRRRGSSVFWCNSVCWAKSLFWLVGCVFV